MTIVVPRTQRQININFLKNRVPIANLPKGIERYLLNKEIVNFFQKKSPKGIDPISYMKSVLDAALLEPEQVSDTDVIAGINALFRFPEEAVNKLLFQHKGTEIYSLEHFLNQGTFSQIVQICEKYRLYSIKQFEDWYSEMKGIRRALISCKHTAFQDIPEKKLAKLIYGNEQVIEYISPKASISDRIKGLNLLVNDKNDESLSDLKVAYDNGLNNIQIIEMSEEELFQYFYPNLDVSQLPLFKSLPPLLMDTIQTAQKMTKKLEKKEVGSSFVENFIFNTVDLLKSIVHGLDRNLNILGGLDEENSSLPQNYRMPKN
ncbi:MAG: hypothetical protein QNJ31_05260 [Candidatus Caenarcaniphilales bacterium]|nr:hypothetical protein [Candidatus Caenarcaniphilales bacterium]